MPAAYDLPPYIDKLTIEDAVKLMLLGFFGTTAPSGGGGLPVVVTSESTAEATAANPVYLEGQDAPMSQDLSGRLRTFSTLAIGNTALALGQAVMAASLPVVIASNQSNLPANITQVGGSAFALGQALAAASLPVVLTAAQLATLAAAAQLPATLGTKTPALSLGVTPSNWVRHSVSLGASGSQAIPDGAIYQYSILTGTGGDGTMTNLPAGYSDSSPVPIVTGFTVSTNSASSAAVVWFTAT